ncbi:MAG: redox-regulated ATPase YchF [Chloroflexi bacterium]|nr:redox-regulated ATPase YchF [Chloroflexota bacterium]
MELGISGFPKAGKTTVFNALSHGRAATAAYVSGAMKPNLGVAKVPDQRLDALATLFKPQRIVPAEVRYVDIPGAAEVLGRGSGIAGEFLNLLQRCDALVHVVRAFQDPAVPYPLGSVNPGRDIASMDLELTFADLGILERRVQRLEASLKGAKPQERAQVQQEQQLLTGIKAALEQDVPLREQELPAEAVKTLDNYQFLTAKPLLVVVNLGEEQLPQTQALERELGARFGRRGKQVVALCGKLEMDLTQMSEEEEKEFRASLGIGESGLSKVIRVSHALLGLISFFTFVSSEVRAWTVAQDTPAVKAAGKIHTDMERGFIRAEVVHFEDLHRCGSLAEARKQGLLRLEGKTYPVKDGDVVTFLFNV